MHALRRLLASPVLRLALRLGLAALFIYAGAAKLGAPTEFAVEIDRYQLFPSLAPLLAAALPLTEITLGLALVALPALWQRAAALACAALVAVFTVAAAAAVARGLNIDCGCFGGDSGPVNWLTLVRDVALLGVCAFCALPSASRPLRASPDAISART